MQDFRDLKVWEKAHTLTLRVYHVTADLPKDERYGLSSQLRRTAVSIGANIAEGCGRGTNADLARFLQIAMASASELEYELLLARDLGMLAQASHRGLNEQVVEVKRMLASLIGTLRPNGRATTRTLKDFMEDYWTSTDPVLEEPSN